MSRVHLHTPEPGLYPISSHRDQHLNDRNYSHQSSHHHQSRGRELSYRNSHGRSPSLSRSMSRSASRAHSKCRTPAHHRSREGLDMPAVKKAHRDLPKRPHSAGPGSQGGDSAPVRLLDCQHLVRRGVVGLPGGFTKAGHPLLVFPDHPGFPSVPEDDLHLLLKYFISVVPRAEQSPGFALVIDRRSGCWADIQAVFNKIVTLFPAKIKEVFLLYQYPEGKPVLGKLVDDYLLDFDIFHVSHVMELLHYMDSKYLSAELGGSNPADVETWLEVQAHVDSFTQSATKCARRMATFVKILNKEDISLHKNRDTIREVAERNRGCYRRLRSELEDLTAKGVELGRSLAETGGATTIQKLAVQMLSNQLDNTWQYFTSTFKMQDHLYVQYVELYQFQNEFRELSNKFSENEKIIKKLIVTGSSIEEVNTELDTLDGVVEAFSVDVQKAKKLATTGEDIMLQHAFARDSLEPKCTELKIMCKRQEILFLERRRALLKFLDLYEAMENIRKWCETADHHLDRDATRNEDPEQDVLSQIRQLDYLISKARDIKINNRDDFEDDFEDIKDLISAKTLFMVDDAISQMEESLGQVSSKREVLKLSATEQGAVEGGNMEDLTVRREKVLRELVRTEESYVADIQQIITGYKDRMVAAGSREAEKAETIFGNISEIHVLHSQHLLPRLESCNTNNQLVARTFHEYCQQLTGVYCSYCQNMEASRAAVAEMGENSPLLLSCQADLGHQLPLSAYLLKPMQRLTKYQLLLKDLAETFKGEEDQFELDDALEAVMEMVKAVNDSLHQVKVAGLPDAVHPLGSLVCQETLQVVTENKSQKEVLFRNRPQRRQVLLYENQLLFCKQIRAKPGKPGFQFKFSLAIANLGMSSIIKGEDKKMELWVIGQSDVYSLQAKNKMMKEDFATELRKVIIKQKENSDLKPPRMSQSVHKSEHRDTENCSVTSGDGSLRSRRSNYSQSRSLDQDSGRYSYRSHSLDLHRTSSDAELMARDGQELMATETEGQQQQQQQQQGGNSQESPRPTFPQYRALADYSALTGRELGLTQGEVVELVKIGCAGWWYVRRAQHPWTEGWAPHTYLERVAARHRTLDRLGR